MVNVILKACVPKELVTNFSLNCVEDCHTEGSSTEESPLLAFLGTTGKNPLSVPSFLQWTTGQAHIPLIQSEKEAFKINITFEHDCDTRYGQHTICYPTVNACSAAITFPTQHYVTYSDFEKNILQAICGGYKFSRYCTQDNLLLMSILGYIL